MKNRLLFFSLIVASLALCLASCKKIEEPVVGGKTVIGDLEVSMLPENRNAVLEVFTGDHCQYCAKGDRTSDSIAKANPGRVSVINIHQGYFAESLTTSIGDAWGSEFEISAWPSGMINRHAFLYWPVENREFWAQRCGEIMALPSCANLKARATLKESDRHLDVLVEGYYTGSSSRAVNYLHVVLLQNNLVGEQSGAGDNPGAIDAEGNYVHQRVLRHSLSGLWGIEVTDTREGTFFSQGFTLTLPAHFDDVPVVARDMQVVAFLTADPRTEIITGCDAEMVVVN